MPEEGLCGYCDERREEGHKIVMKPGPTSRKQSPEEIAKRIESRKRNKAARLEMLRSARPGEAA
jgi:hypothetical protein